MSFLRGTYGPRSSSKDAFAARREFPSEDPSTSALADDNEVVAFAGVHCDDSSAKATFTYSPTGKKLPVNLLVACEPVLDFLSAWKTKSRRFPDQARSGL